MKVAVIGAGIFGTTAAIHVARDGHEVHLFDELNDLLGAASSINQYRLHRGYHYPRSSETAHSSLASESSFREEYWSAVINEGRHLYAIAKEKSLVSADAYLKFCKDHGLTAKLVSVPQLVSPEKVELVIEAEEARFDPVALRAAVKAKLTEAGVRIHLGTAAQDINSDEYDRIIIAAYAGTNRVFAALGLPQQEYQYEVVEKPVVTLPDVFHQTDLVIMDGPFMCVDPLATTGLYVLGNVDHAIHHATTHLHPYIPENLRSLLNKGVVKDPPVSRFDRFIEHGNEYIPPLRYAKHVGSMYTIRTVFPRLEATDARPTLVRQLDDKHIHIFSGKIGSCVLAAKEAARLVREADVQRAASPRSYSASTRAAN